MSRQPQDSQPTQEGDTRTPVALCKFDEHMMSLVPSWKPLDEQGLRDFLFMSGATEDTLESTLKAYNSVTEMTLQRGGVRVIGVKPEPGDPNVYTVRIPDSFYCLRMWAGGMDYWGQFCLDFFDIERKVPVNLPPGYALYPGASSLPPGPVVYALPAHMAQANTVRPPQGRPLGSWERNMGIKPVPDGAEKWSVPEGMPLMLRRDGHPDFMFQMPKRQAPVVFAQPQMGYPSL